MSNAMNTSAMDLAGSNMSVALSELPSVCPFCHHSVHPRLLMSAISPKNLWVRAVVRCTRPDCEELFFGNYEVAANALRAGGYVPVALAGVAPTKAKPASVPDQIREVSPTFVDLCDQLAQAEADGLDQLVGIGLRKALEFLVKDYAISEHPDKADEVRAATLNKCIQTYLSDPNIKVCAERAAWLGNDETHYVRKWTDRDVKDLKILLRLTVGWIDNQLTTKMYLAEMPEGKKTSA